MGCGPWLTIEMSDLHFTYLGECYLLLKWPHLFPDGLELGLWLKFFRSFRKNGTDERV